MNLHIRDSLSIFPVAHTDATHGSPTVQQGGVLKGRKCKVGYIFDFVGIFCGFCLMRIKIPGDHIYPVRVRGVVHVRLVFFLQCPYMLRTRHIRYRRSCTPLFGVALKTPRYKD